MPPDAPNGWIVVHLDALLQERNMTATELAERIGITQANVSILKTGKAKAIRFSTLMAICDVLQCQPGDLISYESNEASTSVVDGSVRVGAGNVVLVDAGPKPIAVIKVLREVGGLGLKEAKELAENTPGVVLDRLSRPDAEVALVKLRAAGATVKIN